MSGSWYETIISVRRPDENGDEKLAKERYVVSANTFTECESVVIGELNPESVLAEKIAPYKEILVSEEGPSEAEQFFVVKIDNTSIDEKTGKEKHNKLIYLVKAKSIAKARAYIDEFFSDSMLDFTISDINSSKIIGVLK